MKVILKVIQGIGFSDRRFDLQTACNATMKTSDKILLLLFPLFEIKNAFNYCNSRLYSICRHGKDMFYRLQNSALIDWRIVGYAVTKRLINRADTETQSIRCLIADDTDLIKRGCHIELTSKIYSHVTHSFNLGFKGLFLGYHDGKSFFGLDFSLHGEKGKKENYGLSPKQLKSRYAKKRESENPNTELGFDEAYRIYATRWSIEVFFKECKQHLGLGKCQSRDFDAQIAETSLSMMRYNILSLAKRLNDYESLGELFRNTRADSIQLTISERIWLILCDMVTKLTELFEKDEEFIMTKIISDNEQLTKYLNLKPLIQAG